MKKEIIVIGDVEMGAGTLTDDFISDKALSQLIIMLSKQEQPLDLIMNGDPFDFLKCPHFGKEGKKTFPRHITEQISLDKLNLMYKAHTRVFKAWKKFVKKKQHYIIFIIGNHDQDLIYKRVQEQLRVLLGRKQNILFKFRYRQQGVHVEHGHQYDLVSRMNFDKLFLSYKGISILNFSWVSFSLIGDFLALKEQHPFLERVKPWPALFSLYDLIVKKLSFHSIVFILKSLLYYPFRYYSDPTYTLPRTLLREIYYRIKNFDWEVEDIIASFKKSKHPHLRRNKLYVFGHVHKKYVEENTDWTILQPDTWRDEYFLEQNSRTLKSKKKNYVQIKIDDLSEVTWQINTWPIIRSTFHFEDVIKDELTFLNLAAKEEGYTFPQFTTPDQ